MFLILGTQKCKYCNEAKKLLTSNNVDFFSLDLEEHYKEDWRQVFNDLKNVKGLKQRSIPIVFRYVGPAPEAPCRVAITDVLDANKWELIGTFFDLEEALDDEGVLDDDY